LLRPSNASAGVANLDRVCNSPRIRASTERVIQVHESITLRPADFQAFLVALDQSVESIAALNRTFNRQSEQVNRWQIPRSGFEHTQSVSAP
jgi:hypothetical protein